MKLIILLSTYNGEKYLRKQLDSLLEQDFKPFKILIRDDESSDNTIDIIKEYVNKYDFIEYYTGKNKGSGRSFWDLIVKAEDADYYALCDQDDYWLKDKLSRAIELLKKEDQNIPLLYSSKYTLTDSELNPTNSKVSSLYNFSDFPHALLYHSAPGCTFVFNRHARNELLKYDIDKEYFVIHDALIHKIVTLFGKMILDDESHIYYRQHDNNQIGMKADGLSVFLGRIKRFVNGDIRNYRSLTAKSILKVYGQDCEDYKRELLNIVANYKEDNRLKKQLLDLDCFKTHTINDLFFKILVLVNYI